MPILLALVLAAAAPPVKVIRTPAGESLKIGRAAYPLWPATAMDFDGGYLSDKDEGHADTLTWTVDGRQKGEIDFRSIVSEWLQDDSKWGGHSAANQMRYMAQSGGGVSMRVDQILAEPDGNALGLLNTYWDGPSARPVAAQFLVSISPHPLRLTLIKRIFSGVIGSYFDTTPRLYVCRSKQYCIDGDHIEQIDPSGKAVKILCPWDPAEVPKGIAADRWIVGVLQRQRRYQILATDLVRGKSFVLVQAEDNGLEKLQPPAILQGSVSPTSPFVLLSQTETRTGKRLAFTIHLPDGKRQSVPDDAAQVAGPYVLGRSPDRINLYRASTGKLIHTYAPNQRF